MLYKPTAIVLNVARRRLFKHVGIKKGEIDKRLVFYPEPEARNKIY
jgi:hypothetical protein